MGSNLRFRIFLSSLVLLFGSALLSHAHAGERDEICKKNFHVYIPDSEVKDAEFEIVGEQKSAVDQAKPFTASELYKLLGRFRPSNKNVAALFENARVNGDIRSQLNHLISESYFLSQKSTTGSIFRFAIQSFVTKDLAGKPTSLDAALYPYKQLSKDYEIFKRQQKNWDEKPMSQTDAENRARQETSTRYGIPENFDGSTLDANYSIKRYYQDRVNAYTNTDVATLTQKEKMKDGLLRSWLSKRTQDLNRLRVANLLAALKSVSEFDGKKFDVRAKSVTAGTYYFTQFKISVDELFSGQMTLEPPNSNITPVGLGVDQITTWAPGTAGAERLNKLFWNVTFAKGAEHIPSNFWNTVKGKVYFKLSSKGSKYAAKKFNRGHRIENGQSEWFAFDLKDLFSLIATCEYRLGKSDQQRSTLAANKLILRYYYELSLADQVKFIQDYGLKVQPFEKELVKASAAEKQPAKTNLFTRMRDLKRPDPIDGTNGIEWYGYSINSEFWTERDDLAREINNKQEIKARLPVTPTITIEKAQQKTDLKLEDYRRKESPGYSLVRKIKDGYSKAQKWARAAIVGTIVTAGLTGTITGIAAISDLPIHNSSYSTLKLGTSSEVNQISISNDNEAHDSPSGEENASAKVAFSVVTKTDYGLGMPQVPPRNFTRASIVEIADADSMQDITHLIYRRRYTVDENTGREEIIRVENNIDVKDYKGFISIPRPEGNYTLSNLEVFDVEAVEYDEAVVKNVLVHPQTGNILVKIKESHAHSRFQFKAWFKRLDGETPKLDDPRLHNLDRGRLQKIADEISHSDLGQLSPAFQKMLASSEPISVDDIAAVISSEADLYSLRPGTVPKWYARLTTKGAFGEHSRYKHGDTLMMKCDEGNSLDRNILRYYFKNDQDISVDLTPSWIYNEDETDTAQLSMKGYMTTIGHARTMIRIKGKPGAYVIDATPTTLASGEKLPDQTAHYTPQQREKELADAKKKQKEDDEKKNKDFKWPFDAVPGKRREDIFALTDAISTENLAGEDAYEINVKRHQQMTEALNQNLKKILWVEVGGRRYPNTSFQNTLGGRDILPPQRMYILGKNLLHFAENEITLDELFERMQKYYVHLGLKKPANSSEMIQMLQKIADYEIQLWEKCEKLYLKKGRQPFYWAALGDLRGVVFDMMSVAKSYHWQDPKKTHDVYE